MPTLKIKRYTVLHGKQYVKGDVIDADQEDCEYLISINRAVMDSSGVQEQTTRRRSRAARK